MKLRVTLLLEGCPARSIELERPTVDKRYKLIGPAEVSRIQLSDGSWVKVTWGSYSGSLAK